MYLGLDLGTSGVKALLIDVDQKIVGSATGHSGGLAPGARLVGAGPGPTGSAPTQEALDALKASRGAALAAVRGIGLSGQMHGATPPGRFRPGSAALHPVERHAQPCRGRRARRADLLFRKVTGNIVFPGFTAPKLAWVKKQRARHLRAPGQGASAEGLPSPSG